jgi:hypothetical protein
LAGLEAEDELMMGGAAGGQLGARAETYDEGVTYEVCGWCGGQVAALSAEVAGCWWSGHARTPLCGLPHAHVLPARFAAAAAYPRCLLTTAIGCGHLQEADEPASLEELRSIQLKRSDLEAWHNEVC